VYLRINLAWLYAITKYGYPPSIDNVLKVMEDAKILGFDAIEVEVYKEQNLREIENNKEKILDRAEDLGLKIVNFAAILPELIDKDEKVREKGMDLFRNAAELAIFFGSNMIQTDTFTPPIKFIGERPYTGAIVFGRGYRVKVEPDFSWKNFWQTLVSVIKQAARIANEYDLAFTIEPRVGETISNTDAMLRLMEAVNEDNFGAVLDCGHLHAQKELLPLSVEKLGDRIKYVHVSDNDGRDNFHFAPGKGTVDWDGVFQALKKQKFEGYVAIDVGGAELKDRLDEEVIASKQFLIEVGRKYFSDT